MNSFFHADTAKYRRIRHKAIVLTAAPLGELCLLIIWAGLFNMKRLLEPEFVLPMIAIVAGAVLLGMLLCWLYYEITDAAERANERCTYFEIVEKAAVFSRYAGSYRMFGVRHERRMLYIIPLKTFESAYLDEKRRHLILTGKIRAYNDNDENLGYHIKEGFPDFDSWWYNEAAHTTVDMLKLPAVFAKPGKIANALYRAKRDFDALPEPKPYVFRESAIVRKRKELKKLAEQRRYLRTW